VLGEGTGACGPLDAAGRTSISGRRCHGAGLFPLDLLFSTCWFRTGFEYDGVPEKLRAGIGHAEACLEDGNRENWIGPPTSLGRVSADYGIAFNAG